MRSEEEHVAVVLELRSSVSVAPGQGGRRLAAIALTNLHFPHQAELQNGQPRCFSSSRTWPLPERG